MTGKKPIYKLGVMGGGVNSAVGYAHFVASRMDNRWTYAAGCFSRNEETNTLSGQTYNVAPGHVYNSLPDMLAGEQNNLDAVVLLTPTPNHYEEVLTCLKYHMPVICEKSLATSYEQAKTIATITEEQNAFLAMTYNYAGYPMVREIRQLIKSGALGEILHFQAEMPQEGFLRTTEKGDAVRPQSWRLCDGLIPTIYLDLAEHIHHLLDYVLALKPFRVTAIQNSGGWFKDIVDDVHCLSVYGSPSHPVQGSIWFSKSSLGYRNGLKLRIFGSKASVEWVQGFPEEVHISYQNGTRRILDRAAGVLEADKPRYTRFKAGHPAGYLEAFANLYTDIAHCLALFKESGRWSTTEVANATLAAEGLLFLEQMAISAKNGSWQEISYGQ